MRTELEISSELLAAREAYHVAANKESAPKLYERSQAIRGLMAELSALLSDGAVPCPGCGVAPHGHQKLARYETPTPTGSVVTNAIYEVSCLGCSPVYSPSEPPEKVLAQAYRAQAHSPQAAVALWNGGHYLPPVEVDAASVLPAAIP